MTDEIPENLETIQGAHVSRLDADMFNADDIDGVTESMTGSGNLNYLVLQSAQTNESEQNSNPFDYALSEFSSGNIDPMTGSGGVGEGRGGGSINPSDYSNEDSASGLLNTLMNEGGENNTSENFQSNNSSNSLNTVEATHSISSYSSHKDQSSITNNDFPGDDGVNGNDGVNGTGTNGVGGKDGNTPEIPDTTPVDSHIGVQVVSDVLNGNINLPINVIGDLVGGINVDVTTVLGDVLSTDDGLLPNPVVIVDGIIGDNHIINDLNIGPVLDDVGNIVDGVIDAVNPVLGDALPFVPDILSTVDGLLKGINGDSGLFINTSLGLPGLGGGDGIGDLALHVPTAALDDIIGTTNINLDIVSDLSDILSGDFSIPPVDISLLSTGDVLQGLDADIATDNLLGSGIDAVQDIAVDDILDVSDVPDVLAGLAGGLIGSNDENNSGSDTDLNIDTGINIGDTSLDSVDVDAVLDPVENIIGDVDINADLNVADTVNQVLAGDIDDAADSIIDTIENALDVDVSLLSPEADQNSGLDVVFGDGDGLGGVVEDVSDVLGAWPEATIGESLSDPLGGLGDSSELIAALPEPSGLVTEGFNLISGLDTNSGSPLSLGGLF